MWYIHYNKYSHNPSATTSIMNELLMCFCMLGSHWTYQQCRRNQFNVHLLAFFQAFSCMVFISPVGRELIPWQLTQLSSLWRSVTKPHHAETVTTLEATSTSAVVPQSLCLERRRHSFRLFVWNPNQTKLFFSSTFLPPYSATSTFWIANPNNNLINCAAAGSEVSSSLQQPPLTPPAHLPHFLLSPQPLIFLQVEVCLITTLPGQINGCILLLTWESSRQRTEALAHFHYDKVPIIIILLRFQEDTLGGVDSHLSSPV